jgi:uncharacterized protein YcbX
MLKLSEIYVYPIKSLGGISLQSAEVIERGLKYDRRFLLVDESSDFITQRDYPQMAFLKLSFAEHGFEVVNIKNNTNIIIPFEPTSTETIRIKIWGDVCTAVVVNKELDIWFSNAINKKCSLVYMPDFEKRIAEKKYTKQEHLVSFADAYPFLIIGQSSLNDLNSRLQTQIPMNRFRTNFVFTGGKPYEEDNWKDFKIGAAEFNAVKPCARCVITTTDQLTAIRKEEPLKTLSTYRKVNNAVMFGMNLICKKSAPIAVNDKIVLC